MHGLMVGLFLGLGGSLLEPIIEADAVMDITTSLFSPGLGLKMNFVLYLRSCLSELSSKADERNGYKIILGFILQVIVRFELFISIFIHFRFFVMSLKVYGQAS